MGRCNLVMLKHRQGHWNPCMDLGQDVGAVGDKYSHSRMLSALAKLDEADAFAISHQPGDMVRECTFQMSEEDRACGWLREGGTRFVSPTMGVCYSYNFYPGGGGNASAPPPQVAKKSGSSFGLDLTLNTESDFYMVVPDSQNEGIKLVVHDPGELPLTQSDGLRLSVGTLTSVGLSREHVHRELEPYPSRCRSGWGEEVPFPGAAQAYQVKFLRLHCITKFS